MRPPGVLCRTSALLLLVWMLISVALPLGAQTTDSAMPAATESAPAAPADVEAAPAASGPAASPAPAATPSVDAEPLTVEWGETVMGAVGEGNRINIEFKGKTEPKSVISLARPELTVVDATGVATIFKLTIKGEYPFSTNEKGEFQFQLDLPQGAVQVPVVVVSPSGKKRVFQLIVQVRDKSIALGSSNQRLGLAGWQRANTITGGLGCAYQSYNQTSEGPEVSTSSMSCPSNFGEVKIVLDEKWMLLAGARSTPGIAKLSDPLLVKAEGYRWLSLSGEAAYSRPNWAWDMFGSRANFVLRFGGQHHAVPFLLVRNPVAGKNEVVLENGTMSTLSLGGMSEWAISENMNLEIFMRYQHPIFYGGVFSAKSSFVFDGSIGVSKTLSERFTGGLYWLGQYHNYSYSYQGTTTLMNPSGSQKLFVSIFEFRIGFFL